MTKVLIFGGTTEGRLLGEFCASRGINALYCAATEMGGLDLPGISSRTGRLDSTAMAALIRSEMPGLVLDATHPYAAEASANIQRACAETGTRRLRILRDAGVERDCLTFANQGELVTWLAENPGVIFAATGAKEAALFTALPDFQERVRLRLLPSLEGLRTCLELGYPAAHIICMQGPFSYELNRAMFAASGASILVTKNSGAPGGFAEKLQAALELGIRVALLARPQEADGLSLERALAELEGLGL